MHKSFIWFGIRMSQRRFGKLKNYLIHGVGAILFGLSTYFSPQIESLETRHQQLKQEYQQKKELLETYERQKKELINELQEMVNTNQHLEDRYLKNKQRVQCIKVQKIYQKCVEI